MRNIKVSCVMCCVLCVMLMVGLVEHSYARTAVDELSQVEKLFMEGKYERVVVEATE